MVNTTNAIVLGAMFVTVGFAVYSVNDASLVPVIGFCIAGVLFFSIALLNHFDAAPV